MNFKDQNGITVVITLLLIGFLVSMVLALSAIFIPKIRVAAEARRSVTAIYAADSTVEWCLYIARKDSINPPVMLNNATYTPADPAECVSPLKAVGTFQGVSRAFEVSNF